MKREDWDRIGALFDEALKRSGAERVSCASKSREMATTSYSVSGLKPSMKNMGMCHRPWSTPTIRLATKAL